MERTNIKKFWNRGKHRRNELKGERKKKRCPLFEEDAHSSRWRGEGFRGGGKSRTSLKSKREGQEKESLFRTILLKRREAAAAIYRKN